MRPLEVRLGSGKGKPDTPAPNDPADDDIHKCLGQEGGGTLVRIKRAPHPGLVQGPPRHGRGAPGAWEVDLTEGHLNNFRRHPPKR